MKRFCPFLLALLAALALAAPTYAYRDADFDGLPFDGADSGAVTVITDTQGAVHRYDGALDAAAPDEYPAVAAKIASYAIELDGETLLRVELRDFEAASERRAPLLGAGASVLTNGFYAVTFDYDKDCECFVTGLDSDQVGELTDALISAKREFQSIKADTLSFIDAEKLATVEPTDTLRYSNDSKVCWAATTANLLRYTGWAARAHELARAHDLYPQVDDDEDALLDLFTQNFEDGFGNVYYGMTWFFNGRYAPDDYPGEFDPAVWAHKKENAAGGDYLPYPAEDYLTDVEVINNEASIRDMAKSLRDGDGVGISLGWYEEDAETGVCVRTGGHAVTLWGYIRLKDEDSLAFDAGNYVALLTTDSDSDPVNNRITRKNQWSDDRTKAPDCLMLMPLTARTLNVGDAETPQEEASWQVTATGGSTPLGMLTNYVVLKAYNTEYPKDKGTFDLGKSPDLRADMLYIGEYNWERPFEKTGTERAVFMANRELLVYLQAANYSEVRYTTDEFACSVELLRPGREKFEALGSIPCVVDESRWIFSADDGYWPCMTLDGLEAGSYTIRVTVPETPTREAYYYNNSIEMHFTVAEPVYDLSGVSLAIAGATQDAGTDSVGNPLYGLPLALTGLDTAGVRLTGCYAAAEHLWYDPDTDSLYWEAARSVQDCGAIAEPEPVLLYGASRVRVRMLLKPADDKTPWPVVEREIALLDQPAFREETNGTDYYYIGAKCSLLERTVEPWSSWSNSAVYVAGYDRDGRLLFFTRSQSGAGAAVAFDEAVRTLRLFWVGTDGKPQGAPIDVEV